MLKEHLFANSILFPAVLIAKGMLVSNRVVAVFFLVGGDDLPIIELVLKTQNFPFLAAELIIDKLITDDINGDARGQADRQSSHIADTALTWNAGEIAVPAKFAKNRIPPAHYLDKGQEN